MKIDQEERLWAFRPQALWWSREALTLRHRLFSDACSELCHGMCRPADDLSRQQYQNLLSQQGEYLTSLLQDGWLVGREEQVLLVVAFLVMCKGFPPVPTLRWCLTWALENIPEKVAERLDAHPKGATPEDIVSVFWSPPDYGLQQQWENLNRLPPLYETFGCISWDELESLPLKELWRRCYVEGRWKFTAKKLVRLALAHQDMGQASSVSHDRQTVLSRITNGALEDSRGAECERYTDLRLSLERIIADAPSEQATAGTLWLESESTGYSFREVCLRHGEDPNRAKANLHRLLQRARKELTS